MENNLQATSQVEERPDAAIIEKIRVDLAKKDLKLYWHYNDEISIEAISNALESHDKYEKPLWKVCNDVRENNIDNIAEIEREAILEVCKDYRDELVEALGYADEDFDIEDYASSIREEVLDCVTVDDGVSKQLKKQTVNVRICMYSNYDCMNSFWFESQGGFSYPDSYFSDVIKALRLDPAKVKKLFTENGVKTYGVWERRSDKHKQIEYDALWQEMENQSCPAVLLTYVAQVNAYDLLDADLDNCTVVIPKGNTVGFYSDWQGGGSLIEAPLLQDTKIKLGRKNGFDGKYGYFALSIDEVKGSYSMKNCYGVANDFFGDELKIIAHKTKKSKK